LLQVAAGAYGILVDQPHVLKGARSFLDRYGVADRCRLPIFEKLLPTDATPAPGQDERAMC